MIWGLIWTKLGDLIKLKQGTIQIAILINKQKINSDNEQMRKWLPKEEWNKMPLEQQREYLNKVRRSINNLSRNKSQITQEVQQKSIPS